MNLLSTKEVVEKFDMSYQTLNYYTNLGFFNVIERRGNVRMYDEGEISDMIKYIRELKNQGYPLRLIVKKLKNEVV